MKTILHTEWTVADICKGFTYNELEEENMKKDKSIHSDYIMTAQ